MKILCKIGLHLIVYTSKFLPSIHAIIVTDYFDKAYCKKCGKVLHKSHLKWNGEDMVEV